RHHGLAVHSYPELLANPESTWTYRGEGNANIVFSGRVVSPAIRAHLGTSHLVLRVAKRPVHACPKQDGSDQGRFALNTVRFITQVINPLFPDRYLPRMLAVHVTPEFLQALDSASSDARPAARTAKGVIDMTQCVALVSPDYARMDLGTGSDAVDTLCLEIKPKWLFIPRRHRSTPDPPACSRPNRAPTPLPPSPHRSACRFCAHQRYKLATDPGHTRLSGFCPLDLLSPATIRDAVHALLDAPGNNLRVWMNGERTSAPAADTRVFSCSGGDDANHASSELVPLFLTLGEHQERLDDVADSTQLHEAYLRVCQDELVVGDKGLGLDSWAKVVQTYLRPAAGPAAGSKLVAEFVLSMTLKDCSVLITVAPWSGEQGCESLPSSLLDQGLRMVRFADKAWVYRATLLDLDPKQMGKVPEWLRLDREIRKHFVASVVFNVAENKSVGKGIDDK
ncbi:inositol-pentakisphosphate 2-kinase, partial [Catenaria anguillulae PL171]